MKRFNAINSSVVKTGGLLMVLTLVFAGWFTDPPESFEIKSESRMWIDGTSTIHDFTCDAQVLTGTLSSTSTTDATAFFDGLNQVTVSVPVAEIDCGKGTMNKKMRKALDAEKAPLISFALKSTNVVGPNDEGGVDVKAKGDLTIAGKTLPVEMDVKGQLAADGSVKIDGAYTLNMRDYDVDPPTAMFGALKTHEDVTVRFEVVAAPGASL